MINPRDDFKVRARLLADDFGWDVTDDRKNWTFGPDTNGPNLLVDQTKAVQYLDEIKDSVVSCFQGGSRGGPVAEESMRSVRWNILDVTPTLILFSVVPARSCPLPVCHVRRCSACRASPARARVLG